jgi:hypothetical protein
MTTGIDPYRMGALPIRAIRAAPASQPGKPPHGDADEKPPVAGRGQEQRRDHKEPKQRSTGSGLSALSGALLVSHASTRRLLLLAVFSPVEVR